MLSTYLGNIVGGVDGCAIIIAIIFKDNSKKRLGRKSSQSEIECSL
ncbi:hypothetical protein AB6G31_14780 [Providencia hangzhouensis]